MHLPKPVPEPRPADGDIALRALGSVPPDADPPSTRSTLLKRRPPAVRYLGFEITGEGREYSLQVTNGLEPRTFVLLVTHEAFASRQARFQDAPDLCYRKLGRELVTDPDLVPGTRLQLTTEELLDYRDAREQAAPGRKRRGSGG